MDDEGFWGVAVNACSFDERRFLQAIEPELRAYYEALTRMPIPEPWLALIAANSSPNTALSRSEERNVGAATCASTGRLLLSEQQPVG